MNDAQNLILWTVSEAGDGLAAKVYHTAQGYTLACLDTDANETVFIKKYPEHLKQQAIYDAKWFCTGVRPCH